MPSKYDLHAVRKDLPLLSSHTYLNTGTEGLMAEPVLAEYQSAVARQEREGHVALEWRHAECERTRAAVARLLNAHSDTVAFTRNATDGHNIVLQGLDWQSGDELLISNQEHPALSHPVSYLQRGIGLTVRVFAIDSDPLKTLQNVRAALNSKTRLVAFSHVSCESGIRLPAKQITALAHQYNALSLLDGAQSLGAMPIDVADLDCDFFVSNGHKWLCGPKETGILYVRPDRLDCLTLHALGAGSFEDFSWQGEDFTYRLQPSARRFEFGTRNHAALVGLRVAISHLEDLGLENIYAHMRGVVVEAHGILSDISGVSVLTPPFEEAAASLLTFRLADRDPSEVSRSLWQQGIITRPTATPPGVRASAAYFNTVQDSEQLAAALRSVA
jgi:selenocysteine lyase/cysteine desulfurase